MTDKAALEGQVADLLRETAEAHHEAFKASDGADPDWAMWYATHLATRLPTLLGVAMTRTDLCRAIAALDEERFG